MRKYNNLKTLLIPIFVIFMVGAGLRVIGMTWGLPYQLHPDEPVLFINAWERWDTGSSNLMGDYPEFYIWILVAQREFITRVFGADTPQVIYFFFGRWNSILLSMLILAVAYRLGKQMAGWQAGLFLMAFFALEPISVLDQGWIIKGDSWAWLLMLSTIWFTTIAYQRQSWRWLGLAFVFALLATYAKYNMLFVIFAPTFVALNFKIKREWVTLVLMVVVLVGGLYVGRLIVRHYWVDTIAPAFFHCSNKSYDELPEGQKGVRWLPCGPFVNFQDYVYPIYSREAFWDASTTRLLRYTISLIRREYKPWRLGIGALLLCGTLYFGWEAKQRRVLIAMMLAVFLLSLFLFAMFGAVHPIRQYYVLLVSVVVLLAICMGYLGKRNMLVYGVVGALLIVPYLTSDLDGRAEFLKPDSRAETANYMLDHARRGEAVVIEYDAVEFQPQYGGFPADAGYFNVLLAGHGIFEMNAANFFTDGIYYVVVDERSQNAEFSGMRNELPADFELVKAMEHDDYTGPARWIYRTFRPDYELSAQFGDVAEFIGYDLNLDDNLLKLKLYWHALEAGLPDYTVFVHIRDVATGEIVQMKDQPPSRLTSQWDQYEWVFDEHDVSLELSAGSYAILIGLYNSQTGERLSVNGDPSGVLELGIFEASP